MNNTSPSTITTSCTDSVTALSIKEVKEAWLQTFEHSLEVGKNQHLTQEEISNIRNKEIYPMKCIYHGYSPSKPEGYAQVRYKGVKYYCHRLAARLSGFTVPSGDWDGSHYICNDPWCINPLNICPEDNYTNKSRYCCILFKNKPGYRCPHTPTCASCIPCENDRFFCTNYKNTPGYRCPHFPICTDCVGCEYGDSL